MRFPAIASLLAALLGWPPALSAQGGWLLIQRSPLAGSQYYALGEHWAQLRVGDRLTLTREPDNRHDPLAVRVSWQGHPLGYLPRAENAAVARALDRGLRLVGRIARLTPHPDPWQRVVVEVHAGL